MVKLPKLSRKTLLIGGVAVAGVLGIAGTVVAVKAAKTKKDEEAIETEPVRMVGGSELVKINYLPWTKALYLSIGQYHTPTLAYDYKEGEDIPLSNDNKLFTNVIGQSHTPSHAYDYKKGEDIPLSKYNKLFTNALKDRDAWSPVYADYMDVLNTISALYQYQHQVQQGSTAEQARTAFESYYKSYIPAPTKTGGSTPVQQASNDRLQSMGLLYGSPSVYYNCLMPFPMPSTAAKEVLGNSVQGNRRVIVNVNPNDYRPDRGNIIMKILSFLLWNRKWKGPKYYTDIRNGIKLGCQGTFQKDGDGYQYVDNNWFVDINGWESSYHPAQDRDLIFDEVARKESVWNPSGAKYQYPGMIMANIKKYMDYEIDVVRQGNNVCYYTK